MNIKSILVGMLAMACFLQVHGEKVTLNANGGKVTPTAVEVVQGGTYALPEPAKAGGEFDGWWTAKDGGILVSSGDEVNLSIFANPKSPTLYAQWRKACKITVTGGLLVDGTTTKSGLYRGDNIGASVDESKRRDKYGNLVNEFAYWSYTPAAADLGADFSPLWWNIAVFMPNADLKLTANFVNGFAAYLFPTYSMEGKAEEGDFYWSIDNGKTLFPFGGLKMGYPVKSGKVTLKFYDKMGRWRAADVTLTVDKRGTYKEGAITRYDDPGSCFANAKFVPVDGSTKVKFDANGGNGTFEDYFVEGMPYGWYDIPTRKGNVFAGWWTDKTGGKSITRNTVFDPGLFAGQKTPTLYAHWRPFRKLTLKDDSARAKYEIYSDELDLDPELSAEMYEGILETNSELAEYGGALEGAGVLDVLPGVRVDISTDEYSYDKYGNELKFQKWTVMPSKANLGPDFRVTQPETKFTMPNEDVTLQATYSDESIYYWHRMSTIAVASPVMIDDYTSIVPPANAFEWSPDGGKTWYKASTGGESGDGDGFYDYETGYWVDIDGEIALLKAGKYTITWRSNDPQWKAPDGKWWYNFWGEGSEEFGGVLYGTFTYIPQVVVDVMTFENGKLAASSAGGTVAMNPKDGLVLVDKAITVTAKAAKGYAFQGWAYSKGWKYGNRFEETGATWKFENYWHTYHTVDEPYYYDGTWLDQFVDPADEKVHIVAVFKALSDYSVDDIRFDGVEGVSSSTAATTDGSGNVSVTVKAVVGCTLPGDYALVCGPLESPLTYKLDGKLPDGLKFDAKTGALSGAPKKAGNTTVKITATDPAKNAKSLTVNFIVSPLPTWLVGEYRGVVDGHLFEWTSEWTASASGEPQQCGLFELTVKSDGKVSGKVITATGTYSVSGPLTWRDPESCDYNSGYSEYMFWSTTAQCYGSFYSDGTFGGFFAPGVRKGDVYISGDLVGMRQDTELLVDSPFVDKYYTFAFSATTTYDKSQMQSGYGYLTLKTDKKGVAKVAGQLPDGEKVSMSALVLPFVTNDVRKARLYVFASPSSYKKQDWFAMSMVMLPDGSIESEEDAVWTPAVAAFNAYDDYYGYDMTATITGEGALYSEAKSLENYYWTVACKWSENIMQQDPYYYYDNYGALDFWGYFFNVSVKGDQKGAISLVDKSPAPWVESGYWNCWKDKKGAEITDPSQLSISFTKATGIFTGKASVYFDYPKPTSVSLPYSGVMIDDGKGVYTGFGSAVYTYKYSYYDYGKTKTDTRKVSLPVSLEPAE